ncbi:MAG TPA: thrombospondin type 3 repeat-containing protein, partial [Anaerolineales bacterium]|nr:thrombospondin type 3 repeat-containing protein [Anaerolineales bacterium]
MAALAVSFFAVLAGGGDSRDVSASFTAASPVTLSTKAANTVADTTITTTIPSGDYNFSLIAWGTPSQATVAYGPGHTSFLTTHPALGDIVGTFTTTASYFGFSDTPCAANVTLSFTLLNATVDKTSAISPLTSPGPAGPLENMWTDTGGGAAANGLPAQVDKFPSYLNTLFTPDGGSSVQPRARYAAAAKVAGTVLTLNFVVFDSDALANAFAPPHPFDDLKGLGYTTVVVLNDPTQPGSQVSVTDFCTPFTSMTTLFGQSKVNPCKVTPSSCTTPESINSPSPGSSTGKNRYNNPGTGGTYLWTAFHQSLRDTDGDGKENQLDPCPTTVDSLNPLLIGGDITNDSDLDAIPNACDTTPLNVGDHDQDDDGWSNALDNCPRTANPTQSESES